MFRRKREAAQQSDSQSAGLTKTGSYEERIIHAREPQKALSVSAVYRATELRAKTIGQMPVQYQRRDEKGGNFIPWMQ